MLGSCALAAMHCDMATGSRSSAGRYASSWTLICCLPCCCWLTFEPGRRWWSVAPEGAVIRHHSSARQQVARSPLSADSANTCEKGHEAS